MIERKKEKRKRTSTREISCSTFPCNCVRVCV